MRKTMRRKTVGEIGSVSSGTLNPSDLFSAYMWELGRLRLTAKERARVRAIDAARLDEDAPGFDERLHEDVEELAGILGVHSPYGCYFGPTEGDEAEIGWWPDAFLDDDCLTVADTGEVPRGYTGLVKQVSDHGNVTLYRYVRGRGRELWAIV